jgi:inosine-uridine nucleoside N-ribohydrolase
MPTSTSRLRVVLDTDTYNEVDDQFALAHLLMSPEQVELEAVYAAPFLNARSTGPGDGMEKSYEEIVRVTELVPAPRPPKLLRGSSQFLSAPGKPVESPAAADLVSRAMARPGEKLYVLAIAAPTNVASALLLEPRIADNIVIVWLGGNAPYWPDTNEFNMQQDVHSSRTLLDTGVPLVLLPCCPVTSHITTTVAELEAQLAPFSKLGAYLTNIVRDYRGDHPPGSLRAWAKVIWDISASAWAVNRDWVKTRELPCPILKDDMTWQLDPKRRRVQIAEWIDRDAIFTDFFTKAAATRKS